MQEERRSDLRERERDLTHLSLVKSSESRPQKAQKEISTSGAIRDPISAQNMNVKNRCKLEKNCAQYEVLPGAVVLADLKSLARLLARRATLGCEEGKMHGRTGSAGEGSCSNKVPRSVVGR
jgi:hypothetical protein